MTSAYQVAGALAILVSLVGTWLAVRHPSGWLLCVVSSTMWFPALVTGNQWAAVANCGLSIAICLRNFRTQSGRKGGAPTASSGASA
jgi:hypothetical protein